MRRGANGIARIGTRRGRWCKERQRCGKGRDRVSSVESVLGARVSPSHRQRGRGGGEREERTQCLDWFVLGKRASNEAVWRTKVCCGRVWLAVPCSVHA
jgi:hypothetical protein